MTRAPFKRNAGLAAGALLASSATLVCCVLPAVLVTIGAGASLAGLVTAVPQLIWMSEHKPLVFSVAGAALLASGIALWVGRRAPCPADPALARSCARLRRISRVLYLAALFSFAVGALFAFALPAVAADAPPSMPADHDMSHMSMDMSGALGSYSMTREASGTSWQPDSAAHAGLHVMQGDWMLMGHALLNGVYDWQQGPRGDTDTFISGMVMGMAQRHFDSGNTVQLRAMLSPEPLIGKSGYPVLLASGETADGSTQLVDRQHPHDLFMELSGTYSHEFSGQDSVFLYAGLPGEPAFGPPAFMHRQSILDSPEAPISHHWLDSTHITYGVVTAGVVHDTWKIEASRFHGREPDQFRYNIEYGTLDSTSARLSWNPARDWSLQASWAHQVSPEQLAPDKDQTRFSASAIYTRQLGEQAWWSTTLAWGNRRSTGDAALNAYMIESALKPDEKWTIFARAERERNDELLLTGPVEGNAFTVGKASVGAIRDFRVADHVVVGAGALYALNLLPATLGAYYGRTDPQGAMAFLRFKVD